MSKQLTAEEIVNFDYYAEKRENKKRKKRKIQSSGLVLNEIEPMTKTQEKVFESYFTGNQLVLQGCAGTGKTFLSLYLSIRDVLSKVDGKQKVIIVRSVVPTRDMGFLPGNLTEKSKVYELPYKTLVTDIFGRGDAYDILKGKDMIEFTTTSFIRGQTWDNCIVIIDESQNLSFQELNSVITRIGENSRIILSGDTKQDDLTSERFKEESGLTKFLKVLNNMNSFDVIEFKTDDIVRSGLVREYIKTCYKMGI